MKSSYKDVFIIFFLIIISALLYTTFSNSAKNNKYNLNTDNSSITKNTSSNSKFLKNNDYSYLSPELQKKDSYTLIIIGDSMVDVMGENFDSLRDSLKAHYPNTTFGIFNYGFGSTTLESLMDRLTTVTENEGNKYSPVLSRQFDIIIIESFGHNPLIKNGLESGLIQQEKILSEAVNRISNEHQNSLIIFLATIGANSEKYADGIKSMKNNNSTEMAEIRNTFIENHIKFAEEHNIPIIDVYNNTLNESGTTAEKYIDPDSWIHPSDTGIDYISQTIADYLYQKGIIPRN